MIKFVKDDKVKLIDGKSSLIDVLLKDGWKKEEKKSLQSSIVKNAKKDSE